MTLVVDEVIILPSKGGDKHHEADSSPVVTAASTAVIDTSRLVTAALLLQIGKRRQWFSPGRPFFSWSSLCTSSSGRILVMRMINITEKIIDSGEDFAVALNS